MRRRELSIAAIAVGWLPAVEGSARHRVGDRWSIVASGPGETPSEGTETITAVGKDRIEVLTDAGGLPSTLAFATWGRHPPASERSWHYAFTAEAADGSWRTGNTRTAWLAAKETITTAAGPFDCVRIEASGFWTDCGDDGPSVSTGSILETAWYAPALGRVVRYAGRSRQGTGGHGVQAWSQQAELSA